MATRAECDANVIGKAYPANGGQCPDEEYASIALVGICVLKR